MPSLIEFDRGELARLVSTYDRPGPRYTSYPTAVQFSDSYDEDLHRSHLAAALERAPAPLAAYIHIPFCEERCTYCGCHVIPTKRHSVAEAYVERVVTEAERVAELIEGRRPLAALHIGGGTPTYLSPDELRRLVDGVADAFSVASESEFSIEVDPRVTTAEQLGTLRQLGFGRVSLGVQDVSPGVQEAIGRHQSHEETRRAYERCREEGFDGINVDLVYGLPTQTRESFAETLASIAELRPDRVALYGYAHLPEARRQQRAIDASTLPRGLDKLELFIQATAAFGEAGYEAIGMDHFALPTDELTLARDARTLGRNFMGYTSQAGLEIIGLGVSSIGDLWTSYAQNAKKLADYYTALDAGRLPIERGVLISDEDRVRRWVIHSILCLFGVVASEFEARFGRPFAASFAPELEALRPLERDGLVTIDDAGVEVTDVGRLFVRNVGMVFDSYLARTRPSTFSRTV